MKMFGLAMAALVAVTGVAPTAMTTAADAQRVVVHERTVVRHAPARRAYVRRAPVRHTRYRYRNRRVCSVQYRNHHRARVCRTVRTRYRY